MNAKTSLLFCSVLMSTVALSEKGTSQVAAPAPQTASPKPQTASPAPQTASPTPQTASPKPLTATPDAHTASPTPQTATPPITNGTVPCDPLTSSGSSTGATTPSASASSSTPIQPSSVPQNRSAQNDTSPKTPGKNSSVTVIGGDRPSTSGNLNVASPCPVPSTLPPSGGSANSPN